MMLVDLSKIGMTLEELNERLQQTGEELGVSIRLQHEEIFRSMHRI